MEEDGSAAGEGRDGWVFAFARSSCPPLAPLRGGWTGRGRCARAASQTRPAPHGTLHRMGRRRPTRIDRPRAWPLSASRCHCSRTTLTQPRWRPRRSALEAEMGKPGLWETRDAAARNLRGARPRPRAAEDLPRARVRRRDMADLRDGGPETRRWRGAGHPDKRGGARLPARGGGGC